LTSVGVFGQQECCVWADAIMAETNGSKRRGSERSRPAQRLGATSHDVPHQPQSSAPGHSPEATGPAAFQELVKQIAELREYALHYASTRVDHAKQVVRDLAMWTVLGLLALAAVVVGLAVGISTFVSGLADGLTALYGGRAWLGNLSAAVIVLCGIAGGVYLAIKRLRSAFMERMAAKYEKWEAQQQARFGRDAQDVAGSAAESPNSAAE
jgi:hypothetical protein